MDGRADGSTRRPGPTTPRTLQLLVVEDDPGESRLLQEALTVCPIPTHLSVAEDGEQALAFLRGHRPDREASRPDVMLISLKLPGTDGFGLLAEIKGDPALRAIPVLVFTSSASPAHIRRSYDLQANCYIMKPVDTDEFFALVQTIVEFWGRIVRLPARV